MGWATYDQDNRAAAEQIAFEALVDDPATGVHIQGGKNLSNAQMYGKGTNFDDLRRPAEESRQRSRLRARV